MLPIAQVEAEADCAKELAGRSQLHASVASPAVADVKSFGITIDAMRLLHRVDTAGDIPAGQRAAHSNLETVEVFRIELGNRLAALQTVQFGGLGGAKASGDGSIGRSRLTERIKQRQFRRGIEKAVRSICRPAVQAATKTTGAAVIAGIAVEHAIVVVVTNVLQPQSCSDHESIVQCALQLNVGCHAGCTHRVIIVFTDRSRGNQKRRARRRLVLFLAQVTVAPFEVEA